MVVPEPKVVTVLPPAGAGMPEVTGRPGVGMGGGIRGAPGLGTPGTPGMAGAAALGDPAVAVAWLANQLATFDIRLKAGEIIMPGALTKAEAVARGDVVRATYDRLGSVSVKFV